MVLYFNSRLFLDSVPSIGYPTSSIKEKMLESLSDFERLSKKDLNWNSGISGYHSEDEDSDVEDLVHIPFEVVASKRKRDSEGVYDQLQAPKKRKKTRFCNGILIAHQSSIFSPSLIFFFFVVETMFYSELNLEYQY